MQLSIKAFMTNAAMVCTFAAILIPQQQSKPNIGSVSGNAPTDAIAAAASGGCSTTTFGYLDLKGKTADFTDEEFGKMIQPALRQGYVLTIYPPTKRGVWVYQECRSAAR
jgi:hypothetical protein